MSTVGVCDWRRRPRALAGGRCGSTSSSSSTTGPACSLPAWAGLQTTLPSVSGAPLALWQVYTWEGLCAVLPRAVQRLSCLDDSPGALHCAAESCAAAELPGRFPWCRRQQAVPVFFHKHHRGDGRLGVHKDGVDAHQRQRGGRRLLLCGLHGGPALVRPGPAAGGGGARWGLLCFVLL